jgi:hypothetical protein
LANRFALLDGKPGRARPSNVIVSWFVDMNVPLADVLIEDLPIKHHT